MLKRLQQMMRALFRRRDLEAEMAEEMRFHRESQMEANQLAGMSRGDARAAANRQFGARGGLEEAAREARPPSSDSR